MRYLGRFFWNVFFWTYERGSWQWDLSCLVFLLIIFGTPQDFLQNHTGTPLTPGDIHRMLFGSF